MEGKKITILHAEYMEWLKKLDFYKDDIMVLQKRLDEVAMKNTDHEILAMVEHFQNQFIIQRNEIDEFHHQIIIQEDEIVKAFGDNPVAINRRELADHPELRDRMHRFEELFHELKQELIKFLAKVM